MGSDGTTYYQGTNGVGGVEVAAVSNRSMTFTLTNVSRPSSPYTIRATRDWAESDGLGGHPEFVFTATGAKLYDGLGKKLCGAGRIAAGGDESVDWVARISFGTKCPLPGTQFVQVEPGSTPQAATAARTPTRSSVFLRDNME